MMKKNVIIGMIAVSLIGIGILTAFSGSVFAEETSLSEANSTENVKDPKIISGGALSGSGTGVNGLQLLAGGLVTTGEIDLHYDGWSIGIGGITTSVDYVLQLPKEFRELAKTDSFLNALSASIQVNSGTVHNYNRSDFQVESDGTVLRISHAPAYFWLIGERIQVEVQMDLGKAITESGVRIPNAENNTNYEFVGGVVESGAILDWDLIGSKNDSYTLPTSTLDPGWEIVQETPTIETVYDTDTTVSGVGIPGADVQVKVGNQIIGTGKVDNTGIYHITISKQNSGTTISVSQNGGVGWSSSATTIVQHKEADLVAPIVDEPIYDTDTVLSGTGSVVGNTIIVKDKNGNEIGRGLVQADLSYSVTIPKQNAYTLLHVTETNGQETSPSTDVVVQHKNEINIPAPQVNEPVTENDTSVTGTGSFAGDTIIITDKNGNEIGKGTVQADLSYSVTIPPQPAYTILHVTETNGTVTSPSTEITVHTNTAPTEGITSLDPYSITTNDGFIHGTYSGNSTAFVVVSVDGVDSAKINVSPGGGAFVYYIQNLITSPNQTVIVHLLDGFGNTIDSKQVTLLP
ncbi:Ig-like domain-containing protein [Enterococcus phoeniculicola]|uniref:Bacterial Ig domain-containing protein n=1 Tax=Enterococcus phoeniculicola ATCC BAA-412 TaxID=1158610 RepID=R3TNC5_9ENTE|nr:Ig-like domain-containing protein [Enterococcus phoeniculicola]EOL42989.1 hypothetical protein UC3_01966 [Enterococcus phoeniculicola ATCC BAA-412]EOT76653.1 hypothetical protein I589_01610 [Enterococcus phoeniculicola ATCC BAA-412]